METSKNSREMKGRPQNLNDDDSTNSRQKPDEYAKPERPNATTKEWDTGSNGYKPEDNKHNRRP